MENALTALKKKLKQELLTSVLEPLHRVAAGLLNLALIVLRD